MPVSVLARSVRETRDPWLSVDAAAVRLGIAVGTLRNWLALRKLEYIQYGKGRVRIRQSVIDAYILAHTKPAVEP